MTENDKTKIKVIHVAENKMKINQILQNFDGKKLQNITPIALTIPNIAQTNEKENVLIVNIEDITNMTLVGSKIYDVQKLDVGAQQILDEINSKENSYLKAYEICKNTTNIYNGGTRTTTTRKRLFELYCSKLIYYSKSGKRYNRSIFNKNK